MSTLRSRTSAMAATSRSGSWGIPSTLGAGERTTAHENRKLYHTTRRNDPLRSTYVVARLAFVASAGRSLERGVRPSVHTTRAPPASSGPVIVDGGAA